MHRLLHFGLLSCVLSILGCAVLDFDVERPIPEQRVSGSLVAGALGDLFESPVPLNVDIASETEARDTGPAEAVRLTALTLAITDTALAEGDSDDFDFIDSIEVFVESRDPESALERRKIAELQDVPRGATRLSLETLEDVNLLPYVNEGARITASATGSAPSDDVTYDGRIVLHVEVL